MKKTIIGAALMAFAMSATVQAEDALRIGTEGAYPPFNNVNADGELVGFDVDIANALCAEMKRECELVAQDWDGIIPALVNNKYDAIIASMSITEERMQAIDFTDPYYSNYLSVIAAADTTVTQETLGDAAIGAQRSTIGSQWAEDTLGSRADIKLYDTLPAAFSDLQAGRVDTVIADFLPGAEWIGQNDGFSFVGERIDIEDKIGIGIRKGESELADALNAALAAIRENGTYEEISVKYFGVDIY